MLKNMEEKTVVTSKQFTLDWRDTAKSLLMAVLGAVMAIIETSISAGDFHFDWNAIWKTALAAAVAYLAKNFFTKSETKVATEPTK